MTIKCTREEKKEINFNCKQLRKEKREENNSETMVEQH